MNFFKPDDFGNGEFIRVKDFCEIANAKLEREGKVCYQPPGKHETWITDTETLPHLKRALLINIEPIEEKCGVDHKKFVCGGCFKTFDLVESIKPCEHHKANVTQDQWTGNYKCDCGAKVSPIGYRTVRE